MSFWNSVIVLTSVPRSPGRRAVGAGSFGGGDGFAYLALVPQRGRQDLRLGHEQHELGLDVDRLGVILSQDGKAAFQLPLGVDLVLGEQVDGFLLGDDRKVSTVFLMLGRPRFAASVCHSSM